MIKILAAQRDALTARGDDPKRMDANHDLIPHRTSTRLAGNLHGQGCVVANVAVDTAFRETNRVFSHRETVLNLNVTVSVGGRSYER